MHQRNNCVWSFGIVFANFALASGTCLAQIRPYAGGGFGLPGMGFRSSYVGDAGVDLNVRRLFAEVEAGADTGDKEDTGGLITTQVRRGQAFGFPAQAKGAKGGLRGSLYAVLFAVDRL